ncbi:unnamed protein product [Toxocara canis]|uniref:Structural maintenance of chromosomes protein n=1 Tax=Toxocara canis TaxID=6265 RepID=A0A183UC18_TOXCA|nr:unnamed protein product [Toxocara canis]
MCVLDSFIDDSDEHIHNHYDHHSDVDFAVSMGRLLTLELEDFKSYKGKHIIGPFAEFTAIIGSNGSGKSNLVDALSFVLGEKAINLRVKKLADLIHGATSGKPVASKCRVMMSFEEDGGARRFERTVSLNSSEYCIDSKASSYPQQYSNELEKSKIFVKAKNFLVCQGEVERLALRTPAERTQLFEELSRSCEYKSEYDQLKVELAKEAQLLTSASSKRRNIAREKRQAQQEMEEARRYERKKAELASMETELYLTKLYYLENDATKGTDEVNIKKGELEQLMCEKEKCDGELMSKSRERKKLVREANTAKELALEKKKVVDVQKACHAAANQKAVHAHHKLEAAIKVQNTVRKIAEDHANSILALRSKISELECEKAKCKAELDAESRSLGLQLSDSQVHEYGILKGEAIKRCGVLNSRLLRMTQQRDADQNVIYFQQRMIDDLMRKIKNKEAEIERNARRAEELSKSVQSQNALFESEQNNITLMEQQAHESKVRMEKLKMELEEVCGQLADAGAESAELDQRNRRADAIESLKRVFANRVIGRLVDLCRPAHERFRLAVTKVLAGNMMAIVCDTDQTARQSIAYLKQQHCAPETFLPLSILSVEKLSQKLRQLKEPRGVNLVHDVIQCINPLAQKAVLFACGNTLVCETADDARKLAFGDESGSSRLRVVALDGTCFERNGVISGGGQDLRVRARRMLKERYAQLLQEKERLQQAQKTELDIMMKREQLSSLAERIKCTGMELQCLEKETSKKLEGELEMLNAQLATIQLKISEVQPMVEERNAHIEELEVQRDGIRDEVFRDFCQQLNISDIQFVSEKNSKLKEYERREMRFLNTMREQVGKIDAEIDRLRNELDYLSSDDKKLKVKQEEEKVLLLTGQLEELQKKETAEERKLQKLKKECDKVVAQFESKKVEVDECEACMSALKKDAEQATRKVKENEKQLASMEQMIINYRHEHRSLLEHCKVNGVEVPLTSGTLADVDVAELTPSIGGSEGLSQPSQQAGEQMDRIARIEVDFTCLPAPLKLMDNAESVKEALKKMSEEIDNMRATIATLSVPHVIVDNGRQIRTDQKVHFVAHAFNQEGMEWMDLIQTLHAAPLAVLLFCSVLTARIVRMRDQCPLLFPHPLQLLQAEIAEECESATKRVTEVRQRFDKVKAARYARFQECFQRVGNSIDDIYKRLYRDESAQAVLIADDGDEPYVAGISYSCVVPGKRFQQMDRLSGGEKTLASLALLFALHYCEPSPFLVFDEADAALDSTNIQKIRKCPVKESLSGWIQRVIVLEYAHSGAQMIAISLKEEFYKEADIVLGVHRISSDQSAVLSFDLRPFSVSGRD